jgi:hypothetical protein
MLLVSGISISQLVTSPRDGPECFEDRSHNSPVAGSSPARPTKSLVKCSLRWTHLIKLPHEVVRDASGRASSSCFDQQLVAHLTAGRQRRTTVGVLEVRI